MATTTISQVKACTKCGEVKPRTEFYALRKKYVAGMCKVCANADTMARYRQNKLDGTGPFAPRLSTEPRECRTCHVVKQFDQFSRRLGGRDTKCKACSYAYERPFRLRQPHLRERQSWTGAIARCTQPDSISYPNYGGRGITICKRWLDSFAAFLEDMGPRPPEHTLERVDNNGPYCKENCVWATQLVQSNNTRRNRHVTAFGRTQTVAQWVRETGLSHGIVTARLNKGIVPELALTAPPQRVHQSNPASIR